MVDNVPASAFVLWDVKNNKPYSADNPFPITGGGGGGGGGGAVTVADGADVAQGTTTDAAWNGTDASANEIKLQKAIALAATSNAPVNIVLDTTAAGQKAAAQSLSVVDASDSPFVVTIGTTGDAPAADDTTAATLIALVRRGLARWTTLLQRVPVVGAALAAASMPVALATDQLSKLAQDGTDATGVAAPTGGVGLRGWLSGIYARVPALGSAAMAASAPVTIATDDQVRVAVGAAADNAATADTGTFSLNALVKRALARWTTLFTLLPASLGQKTGALSLAVVVASDNALTNAASENHIGNVTGASKIVSAGMTRPANTTAYAQGQAIQASTAASMALAVGRINGATGRISRLRLTKSSASLTNATFRVHLFTTGPTTLPADGAAFTPSGAASYIGSFTVAMSHAFTDGASDEGVPDVGSYVTFLSDGGARIWALLEARAAYTPASAETFTVTAEVDCD